jgi:enediyne biosynthesis protein E4
LGRAAICPKTSEVVLSKFQPHTKRTDGEPSQRVYLRREGYVKTGPFELAAFDRLAILYRELGQPDRAAVLRQRKTELDGVKDRYRRLLVERSPISHFDELAELAEALDRPIEAHGWWTLAYREKPGNPTVLDALARLTKRTKPTQRFATGTTLLDRMASLLPAIAAGPSPIARAARMVPDPPIFRDDAESAGLHFVFDNGQSPVRQLPETTAGGVGLLDYDGDGWLDVYVVQGGVFPPRSRPTQYRRSVVPQSRRRHV